MDAASRWASATTSCARCCMSASPSSMRSACRRMPRSRRRSRPRARSAARTRPAWSTRCCAARQREGLPAGDARARTGRSGCCERLQRDWPQDDRRDRRRPARRPAPLWLRVNRQRSSARRLPRAPAGQPASKRDADAALRRRAAPRRAGAGRRRCRASPTASVSVQDASAQLVADALAPAPGARVLDACAAPGGKAAHLLERDPSLRLTALDIDAGAPATGARHASSGSALGAARALRAADATDARRRGGTARRSTRSCSTRRARPPASCAASPMCCCTGASPTSPRWSRPQARLLDALWRTLAPGGVLLYATCSILHDENAGAGRGLPRAHAGCARRAAGRSASAAMPAAPAASACRARTAWTDSSTRGCARRSVTGLAALIGCRRPLDASRACLKTRASRD